MAKMNPWMMAAMGFAGGAADRYQKLRDEDREAQRKERESQLEFVRRQAMETYKQQQEQDRADATFNRDLALHAYGNTLQANPSSAADMVPDLESQGYVSPQTAQMLRRQAIGYQEAQESETGPFRPTNEQLRARRMAEQSGGTSIETEVNKALLDRAFDLVETGKYTEALAVVGENSDLQRSVKTGIDLHKEQEKEAKAAQREQEHKQAVQQWMSMAKQSEVSEQSAKRLRQAAIDAGIDDDPQVKAMLEVQESWDSEYQQLIEERLAQYYDTEQGADVKAEREQLLRPASGSLQVPAANEARAQALQDSAVVADRVNMEPERYRDQLEGRERPLFQGADNLNAAGNARLAELMGLQQEAPDYISARDYSTERSTPAALQGVTPTRSLAAPTAMDSVGANAPKMSRAELLEKAFQVAQQKAGNKLRALSSKELRKRSMFAMLLASE